MTDTYNGYSSLKWYLWSLKVCRTTIQAHWLWGSKGTVVCTPCGRQMSEVSPIWLSGPHSPSKRSSLQLSLGSFTSQPQTLLHNFIFLSLLSHSFFSVDHHTLHTGKKANLPEGRCVFQLKSPEEEQEMELDCRPCIWTPHTILGLPTVPKAIYASASAPQKPLLESECIN